MHQDLFSVKYGDGVPEWATLDEGADHPPHCNMWYEAYLQSEAVIRSADNFWQNKVAADGLGLLDHYEAMWKMIAEAVNDCDNIIGFEPMNEPFMGSLARNAFGMVMMEMQEKYPGFSIADPTTADPVAAVEFMERVGLHFQEFDRNTLMDFYRRIEKAVKLVSDKPVVTGGNIYCSSNVRTGIARLSQEDGCQIYDIHAYDSVVDTDSYEGYNLNAMTWQLSVKRETQEALGLPVILGEWGAFPPKDFAHKLIDHTNNVLEQYQWSSTYWSYQPGFEAQPEYAALYRAYPMEVAGNLLQCHYDATNKSFVCEYEATDVAGETKIFVPFLPQKVEGNVEYRTEALGVDFCYVLIKTGEVGKIKVSIQ